MEKILKSKKTLVLISLLLIAVIVSGVTLAWFTSRAGAEGTKVELGRLRIDAKYDVDTDDDLYEPGLNATKAGTVSNVGTLAFLAKVDLDGVVTIRSDLDGNPLTNSYDIPVSEVDGIDITISEDYLGYCEDGDNFYMWFTDPATGDLYIMMDGNLTADLEFDVNFDGKLGNLYQGASVSYSKGWLATQVMPGAIEEIFGIDIGDLEPAGDNDFSPGGFRAFSADGGARERILQRIDELLAR